MSLLFRVRARLCALPLAHVVETMRPLPVQAISSSALGVLGLAMIRGEAVPVLDLAALLGSDADDRETQASPRTARFVTVRAADRRVALAVDGVTGARLLTRHSFRALPPLLRDTEADVVESIGALDAELLLVLRAARLVPQGLPGAEGSS